MRKFFKTLKDSYIEGQRRKAAWEIANELVRTNRDFRSQSVHSLYQQILEK